MPTEPEKRCSECDRKPPSHSIGCIIGNQQAKKAQDALEQKTAVRQLKQIRACPNCDLCEDHHD